MKATREEYLKKQEELLASIRTNVQDYNTAYSEKRFDDAVSLNASIEQDVDSYNKIAQKLCFDELLEAEDPMRAAVLKLSYPVIGIKDTMEGEEVKVLRRVLVGDPDNDESAMKTKQIDLEKLHKLARERNGNGIGKDTNWIYMAERLNLLFALDCAISLGKGQEFIREMSDCYAIREASRGIDFGVKDPKAGSPVSNTGLLKAVRAVVAAMIGEEDGKAMSHDVKFLKQVCAKKSRKALTIQCVNHRYMRGYLMEVCNRILTNGEYDVEYKKVEAKK